MRTARTISWEEAMPIVGWFTVWGNNPELAWFQKDWKSLEADGLTKYTNDVDRH